MKIKMTEWFQGTGFPTLIKGEEYSVPDDVSEELVEWLVDNHKAINVPESKTVDYFEVPVTKKVEEPSEDVEEELENVMTSYDPEPEIAGESVEVTDDEFVDMMESLEVDATSAAIKFAKEEGVDLALVIGTGSNGRVILPDVQNFLEDLKDGE